MTDVLTRDPSDTGEIPTGPAFDPANPGTHAWDCYCDLCRERDTVGESTQRLRSDIATAPFPTLRRSAATVDQPPYAPTSIGFVDGGPVKLAPAAVIALVGGCRRMDTDDPEEFEVVTAPAPPPAPKPTVDDRPLSGGEEVVWSYEPVEPLRRGRHRRPSRWDWLTVPLSMAVQVIKAAIR